MSFPAAARLTSCAALIIAIAIAMSVVIPGHAAAQSGSACGPFGDPPAKIIEAEKPDCPSGELLGPWKDGDGTDRYACLYEPASARPGRRFPLLIYLHPSLFGPWTVTHTNLLELKDTFSLGGDPARPGFIVLAPQGRNTTHYYPWPDNRGVGWDNWYRQLSPAGSVKIGETIYPENADAATIDHFIAQAARTGEVDTRRIYVTGWSNGAAMGLLYALNRPNVAAVAVYSGPDPFGALEDPCRQVPVSGEPANSTEVRIFNPRVPAMHVHNSCDVAGICANGEKLAAELRLAGVNIEDVIVDSAGKRVAACEAYCGIDPNGGIDPWRNPLAWLLGLHHHERWPSQWTPAMLDFFREHPLRPAGAPF
jgi:poly(3-hydroxybutyrate) depolymerase